MLPPSGCVLTARAGCAAPPSAIRLWSSEISTVAGNCKMAAAGGLEAALSPQFPDGLQCQVQMFLIVNQGLESVLQVESSGAVIQRVHFHGEDTDFLSDAQTPAQRIKQQGLSQSHSL